MIKSHKKNKNTEPAILIVHLVAFAVLVLISLGALRQNNLKMLELREAVFIADKSGQGIEESLFNLRDHVSRHMNSDLPKLGDAKAIQLKNSYDRDVAKEQNRFDAESKSVAQRAKNSCQSSKNELTRVDCEQAYIKAHPVSPLEIIYPEKYSIEFVSPRWSFDFAGWSIIITAVVGILIPIRYMARAFLRHKKV